MCAHPAQRLLQLFTHGVMLRGGGEGLVRFVEPG